MDGGGGIGQRLVPPSRRPASALAAADGAISPALDIARATDSGDSAGRGRPPKAVPALAKYF